MEELQHKAQELVQCLEEKGQTITFVESLTCGMAASTLGSVRGASHVFSGSAVTYSAEMKAKIGVPQTIIDTYGVVSDECARSMALSGRVWADSDIAVSFTGVAGPDALEGHPKGTVYIACATKDQCISKKIIFFGNRQEVRTKAVLLGFDIALTLLKT